MVEAAVRGRFTAWRGSGDGESGVAELGCDSDESAIGGSPARGDRPPVPLSSAVATAAIAATTSTVAVTISTTPWRNRISSSRSWMAARSADGRP
jgi:hypothetical protein